jgi:hypothetical protein
VAVQKVKAKKQAQFALPMVEKQLVLPLLLTIVGKENFTGAKNDTVNFKLRDGSIATARDYDFRGRTGPIVLDDIFQTGGNIPVRLNTHVYSATGLEDEHFTLDDITFATDVLAPQVTAVVDRVEAKALTAIRGTTSIKHTVSFGGDVDPHLVAVESKRLMDSEKVAPYSGRVFVVGNDIAAQFRASDRLSRYDSVGLAGTPALRDAVIGALSGSPVVEHNGLEPDEGYYLHGTSFILANAAPDVPRGAVTGNSGLGKRGVSLRWIQDYDANYLRDRSIVSTFMGMNEIRDERDADGNWIIEEGEFDDEELAVMRNADGSVVTPVPVGTRKNVRIVKLDFTGTGSVLDAV